MRWSVPLPPPRVDRYTRNRPKAREAAVDEAVDLLTGPSSRWPVDTGRSKRAFRRSGSGTSSRVYNPVRYASFVEAQMSRPAYRTLTSNEERLMRAARRAESRSRGERSQQSADRIIAARNRRAAAEEEAGIYDLYEANLARAGRRAPPIPRAIRQVDEEVRRAANRGQPLTAATLLSARTLRGSSPSWRPAR